MPTDGELHQVSAAIGRLEAKVEAAEGGRRVLHEKLDRILAYQQEQGAAIAALHGDMQAVKPEVDRWRAIRSQALGGLTVAGLLLSAGGAAAWATIGDTVAKIVRGN